MSIGKGRFTELVATALEPTSAELSEEIRREIRSSWRDVIALSRRLVFIVVLLVALFTLLKGASVAEISFAGIKLAPSAIHTISIALPAVIAYLYSEYWGLYVLGERYEELHDEICALAHPNLDPLRDALHPPDTTGIGTYRFLTGKLDLHLTFLTTVTFLTSALVVFLAPFAFLVVSYVMLISDFGIGKAAVLISLGFSLFSIARVVGFWSIN